MLLLSSMNVIAPPLQQPPPVLRGTDHAYVCFAGRERPVSAQGYIILNINNMIYIYTSHLTSLFLSFSFLKLNSQYHCQCPCGQVFIEVWYAPPLPYWSNVSSLAGRTVSCAFGVLRRQRPTRAAH